MQKKSFLGIAALSVAASIGVASSSQAAQTSTTEVAQVAPKVVIPVVAGAKALSTVEKGGIAGMGDTCTPPPPCPPPPPPSCPPPPPSCPPPTPVDLKPGYGFGTTGHYGPPGQGFTPSNSWRRVVAAGGTTTPKGNDLPPRAFK